LADDPTVEIVKDMGASFKQVVQHSTTVNTQQHKVIEDVESLKGQVQELKTSLQGIDTRVQSGFDSILAALGARNAS
jgi:uncharacterized protein YoxC